MIPLLFSKSGIFGRVPLWVWATGLLVIVLVLNIAWGAVSAETASEVARTADAIEARPSAVTLSAVRASSSDDWLQYVIQGMIVFVPFLTVTWQYRAINVIIDALGWRDKVWKINDLVLKRGNVVAFFVAGAAAGLMEAARLLSTSDATLSPATFSIWLLGVWVLGQKFYQDNKIQNALTG